MIPLLAAALYGMAGYKNNQNAERANARQDKQDSQASELHSARMADIQAVQDERQREKDYRSAIVTATSAGKTDSGYQISDAAGSNAFTKDADAAAMMGDMAQSMNGGADAAPATRVSTGRQGATMNGAVAGNQVFTDPQQAQAFAKAQVMGDHAKIESRRQVAEEFGKMEVSDDLRSKLTKLETEGVFKALSLAKTGDFAGAAKAYESTGNDRMPAGSTLAAGEIMDPVTKQARKVVQLIGADKSVLVPDLDSAARSFLTPSEQYNLEHSDRNHALAVKNSDDKAEYNISRLAMQGQINEARMAAIGARAGSASEKPYRMDEDDRIRMKDADTRVRDAEKIMVDAMKNAMPGDDPAKIPAVAYAKNLLRQSKVAQLKTHVELGQITPDRMVTDIMGAAKSPADVMKSLQEIAVTVGVDFADQVSVALQGNDQWRSMNPPPKKEDSAGVKPAANKPAPTAPGPMQQIVSQQPNKYSYSTQMAEAEKQRLAKQAAQTAKAQADELAQAEQDALVEKRRQEYLEKTGRRLLFEKKWQ